MFIPNDLYCCPIDLNSLNQTMYKIVRNFYNGIFHLFLALKSTHTLTLQKMFGTKKNLKFFKPINSKKTTKNYLQFKNQNFLSIGKNSKKIGIKKVNLSEIK